MKDRAKRYLNQCVEHALARRYYGQRGQAIASFLKNVELFPETAWIKDEPDVQANLVIACDKGQETFEEVLRSFQDQEGCRAKIKELIS